MNNDVCCQVLQDWQQQQLHTGAATRLAICSAADHGGQEAMVDVRAWQWIRASMSWQSHVADWTAESAVCQTHLRLMPHMLQDPPPQLLLQPCRPADVLYCTGKQPAAGQHAC